MGIERSLVQEILAREVYFESFSFKKHQKSHLIDISYRLELAGGVGGGDEDAFEVGAVWLFAQNTMVR